MGINKKNLKRTREHIAEVNGSMIKMNHYRYDALINHNPECKSVGCIIGHATALDAENVRKNFTDRYEGIKFTAWSKEFFGIGRGSALWTYLFSHEHLDIKDYHLYRMDYILAGNKAPTIIGEVYYNYNYILHYDDGYFIPKGWEIYTKQKE